MRDYQMNNVYEAEDLAFEGEGFINELTKEETEKKVWDILNSEFVFELIEEYSFVNEVDADFTITLNDKRHKYPKADETGVVFAENSRSNIIVLHELAHSLTMHSYCESTTPEGVKFTPHGPHFAFVYLKLVEEFLEEEYLNLLAAFISTDVDSTPEEIKTK